MSNKKVGFPQTRPNHPVVKGFHPHNTAYTPEIIAAQYQYQQKRSDVGYSGGSSVNARASIGPPHQSSPSLVYSSSNAAHQTQHTRGQSVPLPNLHNSLSSVPLATQAHSQHMTHPHSVHSQPPHSSLSSHQLNVSGSHSGATSNHSIPQTIVASGQGTPGVVGPTHDLNVQSVQPSSQSIQQGNLPLAGNHSIMYSSNNHNVHHQVQPINQFPNIGISNAPHLNSNAHMGLPNAAHLPSGPGMAPAVVQPGHYPYQHIMPSQPHVSQLPFSHGHARQFVPQFQPSYNIYSMQSPSVFTPPSHQPIASGTTQRSKRIPIIHPDTNEEVKVYEERPPDALAKPSHSPSPNQSRESSAPNTPAPGEGGQDESNPIPAQFALAVCLKAGINDQTANSGEYVLNSDKELPSSHVYVKKEPEIYSNNLDNKRESNSNGEFLPESSNRAASSASQGQTGKASSQAPESQQPIAATPDTCPAPQPQRPPKQPRGGQTQASVAPTPANTIKQQNPAVTTPSQQAQAKPHGKQHNQNRANAGDSAPPQNRAAASPSSDKSTVSDVSKNHVPSVSPQQQQKNQHPAKHSHQQSHGASKPDGVAASRAIAHQSSIAGQPACHAVVSQKQTPPVLHSAHIQSAKSSNQQQTPPSSSQPQVKPTPASSRGGAQQEPTSVSPRKAPAVDESAAVPPVAQAAKPAEKGAAPTVPVERVQSEARKDNSSSSNKQSQSHKTETPSKKDSTSESGNKRNSKEKRGDANLQKSNKDGSTNSKSGSSDSTGKLPTVETSQFQAAPQNVGKQKQPSLNSPSEKPESPQVSLPVSSINSSTSQNQKTSSPVIGSSSVPPPAPAAESGTSTPSATAPTPVNPKEAKKSQAEHKTSLEPSVNHVVKSQSSSLPNSSAVSEEPLESSPGGKRQYDRNQLLDLQHTPLSKKRPETLPDIEVVLNEPMRHSIDGRPRALADFTPTFLQNNANNRMRPGQYGQQKVSGRGSLQGKKGPPRVIDIKLPSSVEVKLKTAENAWKPSMKQGRDKDESNVKHEQTIKKMRGILNKLTPDNFKKLVVQVNQMNVESFETFDALIGIVFEKALDEQAFSSTYADLCKVLAAMSVSKSEESGGEAKFRNLLIHKCQHEFESDNAKELNRVVREKEIQDTADPERKLELVEQLQYDEQQLRRRSVGNIRFIGELYKRQMLTSPIMMKIIEGLLAKKDEESLECLCKLLSTIGKLLEESVKFANKAQGKFNNVFFNMKSLIEKKETSSRVRFLMMDVLDLRLNNWVPRREEGNPKTKAQVHEEIRKEEIKQQMVLDNYNRSHNDRDKNKRNFRDEQASSNVAPNSRRMNFDLSRLKNTTFNRHGNVDNNVFRPGSIWSRGSSGGSGSVSGAVGVPGNPAGKPQLDEDENIRLTNRFSALDNHMGGDNRRSSPLRPPRLAPGGTPGSSSSSPHRHPGVTSFGSKSMPPPSDKESLLASVKSLGGAGERSSPSSRTGSRDSSRARESAPLADVTATAADVKAMKGIVDEFVSNDDLKEATLCVREQFGGPRGAVFVQALFEWMLDREPEKRKKIGVLLHHLLMHRQLSVGDLVRGSRLVMESVPDLLIDVPLVYSNVAEVLARLLVPMIVTLADLVQVIEPAADGVVSIFANTLREAVKNMGEAAVRKLWAESGLKWSSISPPGADVSSCLQGLDFTVERAGNSGVAAKSAAEPSVGGLRNQLNSFFANKFFSDDDIYEWINTNVGKETNSKNFIRALTAALIESLLLVSPARVSLPGDFQDALASKSNFLKKFIDNRAELELSCIYAIQAVSVQYEHPYGLLDRCFTVLYQNEVLSEESFLEWEKTGDPEEVVGRGVCLTAAKQFLAWLREPETE